MELENYFDNEETYICYVKALSQRGTRLSYAIETPRLGATPFNPPDASVSIGGTGHAKLSLGNFIGRVKK